MPQNKQQRQYFIPQSNQQEGLTRRTVLDHGIRVRETDPLNRHIEGCQVSAPLHPGSAIRFSPCRNR